MSLPVKDLDNRRFDQLVEEARQRLRSHLPELTQMAPGDPAHAFIDLFAWLTESIIYRMNLIPERQRRVFLNLLQVPLYPAVPARGVVCLDRTEPELKLLEEGAALTDGRNTFTTFGEVLATPLSMAVLIKQRVSNEELAQLGFSKADLRELYGSSIESPDAFQPRQYAQGAEAMNLQQSIDKSYYLALMPLKVVTDLPALRESLAGKVINVAIAPDDSLPAEEASRIPEGKLRWELLAWDGVDADGELGVQRLPLEVVSDSSRGGRKTGVVRLRLPYNPAGNDRLLHPLRAADPMLRGLRATPPDVEAPLGVAFWLRLSCSDEPDLPLSYLGINGVDVVGQAQVSERVVGVGTGEPDQVVSLGQSDIDTSPLSLQVEVQDGGIYEPWSAQPLLDEHDADAPVYQLDAASGELRFGDGQRGGRRPRRGARIRASFLYGGGAETNVAAGSIKQALGELAGIKPRQDVALSGGIDAETVEEAERRIPGFLSHRNRAITASDYQELVLSNPVNPVARADVVPGLLPGSNIRALRENVPGVVSVFVMPPSMPFVGRLAKPTERLLTDVFRYLLERIAIGTELYVLSPEFVPFAVGISLEVEDARNEQQIWRAVNSAVVDFTWAVAPGGTRQAGWPLGTAVDPRELHTQVARVEGVKLVQAVTLFRRQGDAWVEAEQLELAPYQLPELLSIQLAGSGDPPAPEPPTPEPGDEPPVPTPVIPELC